MTARQADLGDVDLATLLPSGRLASGDVARLAAGVELYAKHLENLAVKAQELGRDREAGTYQREADAIRNELIGDRDADPPVRGRFYEHVPTILRVHVKPIAKGLEFYLKNLRAAKGTMKGLGKTDLAEGFEEEATDIEARLVLAFQEQQSLPLTASTAPPSKHDTPAEPVAAGPAKSLKEIADEEAAREEATQAHEGVTPIHRGGKRVKAT